MKDKITFTDYGVTHYDSGIYDNPPDELKKLNEKYYEDEKSAISKILEDGYIEFPLLFESFGEEIWSSCYLPPEFEPSFSPGFREKYGMDFNIYIPSYQRASISYTAKTLDSFDIENYYICIDPSQYEEYRKYHKRKHLIIRDPSFKSEEKVDLISSVKCPDYLHGGSGVFNSMLYISKNVGEDMYFTMDDDFLNFGIRSYRGDTKAPNDQPYKKDDYFRASRLTPEVFDLKEFFGNLGDFYNKIRNRGMLAFEKYGLNHRSPISFRLGTRSYSCYLTDTHTQLDHKGQHNNDTIVSIANSQAGYVNILFQGLQYSSCDTQSSQGGVTEVYKRFGTLDKSKCLVQAHPDISKISFIFNRIHHVCDFTKYGKMRMLGAVKKDG